MLLEISGEITPEDGQGGLACCVVHAVAKNQT